MSFLDNFPPLVILSKNEPFNHEIYEQLTEKNFKSKDKKLNINNAIKLGKYNVGREDKTLTIPLYMGFLVKDNLADIIVPDIDLSLITQNL